MKETFAVSILQLWSNKSLLDHNNFSNTIHHVDYTIWHDNQESYQLLLIEVCSEHTGLKNQQ